jgi:hypothetical protein
MKESESEVLKIEESESELLCTDSTALPSLSFPIHYLLITLALHTTLRSGNNS